MKCANWAKESTYLPLTCLIQYLFLLLMCHRDNEVFSMDFISRLSKVLLEEGIKNLTYGSNTNLCCTFLSFFFQITYLSSALPFLLREKTKRVCKMDNIKISWKGAFSRKYLLVTSQLFAMKRSNIFLPKKDYCLCLILPRSVTNNLLLGYNFGISGIWNGRIGKKVGKEIFW
jgi:hypothetical protein